MNNLTANLDQVARQAREFAAAEKHKDAQRLRRLTRHAAVKTDLILERKISRWFAVAAFVGVTAVLLMVQLGWLD
jgi:hypothetical protein